MTAQFAVKAKHQPDNSGHGKAHEHLGIQTVKWNGGVEFHSGSIAAHGQCRIYHEDVILLCSRCIAVQECH